MNKYKCYDVQKTSHMTRAEKLERAEIVEAEGNLTARMKFAEKHNIDYLDVVAVRQYEYSK